MTSNSTNQGLASMPAQERSLPVDGRGQKAADQSARERRGGNPSVTDRDPRKQAAQAHAQEMHADWDATDYDEHDEAAGHRARRLLSRSSSRIHRVGDRLAAMQRWLTGERW